MPAMTPHVPPDADSKSRRYQTASVNAFVSAKAEPIDTTSSVPSSARTHAGRSAARGGVRKRSTGDATVPAAFSVHAS